MESVGERLGHDKRVFWPNQRDWRIAEGQVQTGRVADGRVFTNKHIKDRREPIQAISFDVGGTLIEPWPSVGHVYAEVAGRFGLSGVAVEALNRRFAAAWQARRDFDYSEPAWFELVRQTFGQRAVQLPADFFPALYERFAQPDAWRIYDDVLPALDELATAGIRLAVISNWDERLHALLERLKLRGFFEVVIVSCEVGFAKPSPVIFEMALRKLGLPAGAVLHVGDGRREDAEGARAAGLRASHLDRGGAGDIASLAGLRGQLARPEEPRGRE